MRNRIHIANAVLLVVLVPAFIWLWQTFKVIRPRFELQVVETHSFRAWYPADWQKISTTDPALGDQHVSFTNHGPYELPPSSYDLPRRSLGLEDKGTRFDSIDQITQQMRSEGFKNHTDPSAQEIWHLRNGIEAKAWLETVGLTEASVIERWIAFKGSNGHYYAATYNVPGDWKTRWRYEYIFRGILGSIQFK